jgi:DNA-binding CsgD family transcriptional regulator
MDPQMLQHDILPAIALLKGPTGAEARVLELVADGLSTAQIAARLWVTSSTVTFHIGNLLRKMGADNRTGLVARAYALGVLRSGVWPPRVEPTAISSRRRGDPLGDVLNIESAHRTS